MTSVVAQHTWPDGSCTLVEVEVENDYPDALDQARVTAVRGLTEVVAALAPDDDLDTPDA